MENHLIVGVKITDRIQENLDKVLDAHQFYFKDNDPEYLQIHRVDGERILGKKLAAGAPFPTLEDYVVNITSIFHKICPEYRLTPSEIRVYAQTLIG
jgi:hypothetical protein